MRFENVLDKVVYSKDVVFASDQFNFLDRIAVIGPLLSVNQSIVSVKTSISLIVRNGEDKDSAVETRKLFLLSVLIRLLFNPEKGSNGHATAVHVLAVRPSEALLVTLDLTHEEREVHVVRKLCPIVNQLLFIFFQFFGFGGRKGR